MSIFGDLLSPVLQTVAQAVSDVVETTGSAVGYVAQTAGNAAGDVAQAAGVGNGLGDVARGVGNGIGQFAQTVAGVHVQALTYVGNVERFSELFILGPLDRGDDKTEPGIKLRDVPEGDPVILTIALGDPEPARLAARGGIGTGAGICVLQDIGYAPRATRKVSN